MTQQDLADNYIADREVALHDYFRDYQDPEADPFELQKRSAELKISAKEWGVHYNSRIVTTDEF